MRSTFYVMLFSAVTGMAQVGQGPNLYSREKEVALGASLAQQVGGATTPLDNPAALEFVQRLGAKIAAQLPEPRFTYTFAVIAGDQNNSLHEPLSLPGGYVFVPASLFLAAQNEAEFAGMLAHAMAHVAARHGTRAASRGEMFQLATIPLIFYGGWTGYGVRQASATAIPMTFARFQREYEQEADAMAVKLMSAAGYDPLALVRYFGRVWPNNAADVDSRDARIGAMDRAIQQLAPVTSTDEFLGIQEQVRAASKN
jgi:beta-barrel assembly-enhancing protease